MTNASPTAFLTWSMLAGLFLIYLIYHLWSYDRLRCLRWNSGRQPGAFKRVMTYSYLLTIPLLFIFSVGLCVLKSREGYVLVPEDTTRVGSQVVLVGTSIPKPISLWTPSHRHMLLAMYFVFSVGWSLEQVTHFEELAFWLFLLDQKHERRDWFDSWEYRLFYISCAGSILGMPLTTFVSRNNLDTTDAWTFLVGSSTSTLTNIAFLYILFCFPAFLRHVREEGADPDVVVRLTMFYEMNLVRVVFRFATSLPLFILAVDGIQGSHVINRNVFWTDLLLLIASIGQFISASLTLMIFFPRSVSQEAGYRHKTQSMTTLSTQSQSYVSSYYPPGVTSPVLSSAGVAASLKSPTYPPIAVSTPMTASAHHPPFLYRSTRRTLSGSHTEPESELYSPRRTSFNDDDDDESVPGYQENSAYAIRRRSTSKGVEFDLPKGGAARCGHDDSDDDGDGDDDKLSTPLPRLLRRETVPVGTARLTWREVSTSGVRFRHGSAGASSSVLHPYVTSFTSPIDLVKTPQMTLSGRFA